MMPHSISSSLLVIVMMLCLHNHSVIAFSSVLPFKVPTNSLHRRESSSFVIRRAAEKSPKKKRRRRTDDGNNNNNNSRKNESDIEDLPGFDIIEEDSKPLSSSKSSVSKSVTILESDNVGLMDVMKGSSSGSSVVASAKDLIASRDTLLEATFEFDPVAEPLPRLGKRKTNPNVAYDIPPDTMGKKQARSEARKAAALEAEARAAQEERQKNILSSLPILGDMVEEKNQTPLKVSHSGFTSA